MLLLPNNKEHSPVLGKLFKLAASHCLLHMHVQHKHSLTLYYLYICVYLTAQIYFFHSLSLPKCISQIHTDYRLSSPFSFICPPHIPTDLFAYIFPLLHIPHVYTHHLFLSHACTHKDNTHIPSFLSLLHTQTAYCVNTHTSNQEATNKQGKWDDP